MELRLAHSGDGPRLFELHTESVSQLCRDAYSHEVLSRWFADRAPNFYDIPILEGRVYVAELNGDILGFIELNTDEITNIFIDPKIARKGVGTFLLKRGIEILEVQKKGEKIQIEATLNSISFYERHGFEEVGRGVWTSPTGKIEIPVAFMERAY